jgi:hypothetical protein
LIFTLHLASWMRNDPQYSFRFSVFAIKGPNQENLNSSSLIFSYITVEYGRAASSCPCAASRMHQYTGGFRSDLVDHSEQQRDRRRREFVCSTVVDNMFDDAV